MLTVGMEQRRIECHCEWVEWIVWRLCERVLASGEATVQPTKTSFAAKTPPSCRCSQPSKALLGSLTHVRRPFWPLYECFPLQHVVFRYWTCSDGILQWIRGQITIFLHQAGRDPVSSGQQERVPRIRTDRLAAVTDAVLGLPAPNIFVG